MTPIFATCSHRGERYGCLVAAAATWAGRLASIVDELTAGANLSADISVPAG